MYTVLFNLAFKSSLVSFSSRAMYAQHYAMLLYISVVYASPYHAIQCSTYHAPLHTTAFTQPYSPEPRLTASLGGVPARPVHLDGSVLDEVARPVVFVRQRVAGLEGVGVFPRYLCAGWLAAVKQVC